MKKSLQKLFSLTLVLVFATGLVFAAGKSRKQIDSFLQEYEKFVVKAEKVAKSNDMMGLMSLSEESVKLSEKAENLQDTSDWNNSDSTKYLQLTERYTNAISKMSNF